jgi:hypothetical protein
MGSTVLLRRALRRLWRMATKLAATPAFFLLTRRQRFFVRKNGRPGGPGTGR